MIFNRDSLFSGCRPRRYGGLMKCLLILLLAGTPAMGADIYFYEGIICPGSGTPASPYCIDPDGTGFNTSFGQLVDGAGLEASTGDTFHLCCGSPCGTGSCTYRLEEESATPDPSQAMIPAIDPTGGQDDITIRPYCSGGACATVALSGDLNNDGRICSDNLPCSALPEDEPEAFFYGRFIASGWHFDGDPLDLGTRHLIIEKFGGGRQGTGSGVRGSFFWITNGSPGLVVENVLMRYFHQSMWGGVDYYDATIASSDGNGQWGCRKGAFAGTLAVIRISGSDTGSPRPIFRNNEIHGVCGPVIRLLGPYSPAGVGLDFSNNVGYNTETVFNGHNGKNVRLAGNLIYDCLWCLSIEEEVRDFDIEGNTIECRGTYRINTAHSCLQAISVYEDEGGVGNNCSDGGPQYCLARNIHIRRNIIRGSTYLNEPGDGSGWFESGINWQVHTSAGHVDAGDGTLGTSVIENNIVSHVQNRWSCDSNTQKGSLSVFSDDDLLVQNNTVYDSSCFGIMTDGAGNHTVRNNLVVQSYKHYNNSDLVELRHYGTGTLTLQNNNLFVGSTGGDPVARLGGTGYTCAQVNGGSIGATNRCAASGFVNVSGRPMTWDLHLAASDTANRNAGAAQGPAVDIDGQPRSDGQIDIGADEIAGNDTTPPAPPRNLREVP
jgi:hypothetical protein